MTLIDELQWRTVATASKSFIGGGLPRDFFFCMICVDSSFFCNNESNDVANTSSRVNFQSFGPGHDYDAYSTRFGSVL